MLKVRLAEKFDTKEKFTSFFESNVESPERREINEWLQRFHADVIPWWAKRELLRIRKDHYTTSDVLTYINDRFPVFAHISKDDKKLVAYTPDAVMGAADRQLKCNVGKLLSRYFPLHSEEWIRIQIESHVAEVDLEVTFYEGAQIAELYEKFGSVGACMSGKWSADLTRHPALAYNAPNIRLAVVWSADKTKILARCLTLLSPKGEKHYIRNYGHPSLLKWLTSEGYTPGEWTGMKFARAGGKAISEEVVEYAFPYLDANGSASSTRSSRIVDLDGQIQCCTDELYEALQRNGLNDFVSSPSSSGRIHLRALNSADHSFEDFFTKEKVSFLTNSKPVVKLYPEGKALKDNLPPDWVLMEGLYTEPSRTIKIGWTRFLNDPVKLHEAGFRKLSAAFYPEEADNWYTRYEVIGTAEGAIKEADAVVVVNEQNERTMMHSKAVTKDYVLLYGKSTVGATEVKLYAHKKANIIKTPSGKKVHSLTHDLVTLWDGTVDFERGTTELRIFDKSFIMKRGDAPRFYKECDFRPELERLARDYSSAGDAKTPYSLLRGLFALDRGVISTDPQLVAMGARTSNVQLSNILNYRGHSLYSMHPDTVRLMLTEFYPVADVPIGSGEHQRARAVKYIKQMLDEMEAVEAPEYLYPAALPTAEAPAPEIEIIPAPVVQSITETV